MIDLQYLDDDPWNEIPCGWCCQCLPHSLVVATTRAYGLDQADKKDEMYINSLFKKKK